MVERRQPPVHFLGMTQLRRFAGNHVAVCFPKRFPWASGGAGSLAASTCTAAAASTCRIFPSFLGRPAAPHSRTQCINPVTNTVFKTACLEACIKPRIKAVCFARTSGQSGPQSPYSAQRDPSEPVSPPTPRLPAPRQGREPPASSCERWQWRPRQRTGSSRSRSLRRTCAYVLP